MNLFENNSFPIEHEENKTPSRMRIIVALRTLGIDDAERVLEEFESLGYEIRPKQ